MILDFPFPPDYRVEKEALTLIAHGHEVFLFCLDYDRGFNKEDYKGIHLVRYPSNKIIYKLSALAYTIPFYTWIMKRKIRHFLQDCRPDVIHVHDMVIAEAAIVAAKGFIVKIVLDLHENRPASMREYKHVNQWPGKILINLSTWEKKQLELVNTADRVVVVTSFAKEDLLQQTNKKEEEIIVVPNTSTISFSNENLNTDILERMKGTFNVLYIGETSLRRGTDDAIRAVANLKDKLPKLRLWLIGTSSSDSLLKALAKELKVVENVLFEGWQPQQLFASYITGSHVCISPLKRNRHHDTTYANKVFQYMSLERPVIVSDCIAQAQLVKEEGCGLVYEAGDIKGLCESIFLLYEDSSLRIQLGQHAKRAVEERWNWENTSSQLVAIYSTIEN